MIWSGTVVVFGKSSGQSGCLTVQAAGPSRDASRRHTASGLPRIEGRKGKIVDSQLYSSFPNDAPGLRYFEEWKASESSGVPPFQHSTGPRGARLFSNLQLLAPPGHYASSFDKYYLFLALFSLIYLEWPLPLSCNTSFEMSLSRALPLRSGRGALFRASPSTCRLTQHYVLSGRTFSTSAQRDATWGFIGLGQMGRYSQVGEAFNVFQWHCLIDIDNLFVYHRLQHG